MPSYIEESLRDINKTVLAYAIFNKLPSFLQTSLTSFTALPCNSLVMILMKNTSQRILEFESRLKLLGPNLP